MMLFIVYLYSLLLRYIAIVQLYAIDIYILRFLDLNRMSFLFLTERIK